MRNKGTSPDVVFDMSSKYVKIDSGEEYDTVRELSWQQTLVIDSINLDNLMWTLFGFV